MANRKMTMGLIVGNRGFFPDHLRSPAARKCSGYSVLRAWMLSRSAPEESKHGAVETHEESRRCADLFQEKSGSHRRHYRDSS